MKRYVFSLLFVIALVLGMYNPAIASTGNFACSNSGSGNNKLNVCVSNHGNLVQFISPDGSGDHINVDGYVICSSGQFVEGWDAGIAEAGCGNPTISQPTAGKFPVTITRNCNCVQFKQVWATPDNTEKDITLTMTVKNICNFTLTNTELDRYFDGDLNGTAGIDIYDNGIDSVWGYDLNGEIALSLTALTFATPHQTWVETFVDWNPTGNQVQTAKTCFSNPTVPTPTASGDYVGRLRYFLQTLNPGQSKTVKIVYRRY